ncbi:hypothetical protein ES708_11344 [subsurface metagenome]
MELNLKNLLFICLISTIQLEPVKNVAGMEGSSVLTKALLSQIKHYRFMRMLLFAGRGINLKSGKNGLFLMLTNSTFQYTNHISN